MEGNRAYRRPSHSVPLFTRTAATSPTMWRTVYNTSVSSDST